MDINMPVLNGLEATRQICADPDLKATTVIAMTANTQIKDVNKALRAGMKDYLIKPFDEDQLLERVQHHLSNAIARPCSK